MPPVGRPRRKARGDASDVTSELVSDEMTSLTTTVGQTVRRTESESSASEAGVTAVKVKKYKSEKAAAASAAAVTAGDSDMDLGVAASSAAVVSAPAAASTRESRPRKKPSAADIKGSVSVADVRRVTDSLYDVAFGLGLPVDAIKSIVDHGGKYEDLVMQLLVENERLKGKLEALQSMRSENSARVSTVVNGVVPGARGAVIPGVVAAPAVPLVKPAETWSVVVRGKGGATSKQVVDKVVGEVAPALGVRVHEVRPIKDGGAVIRTRSVAERQKIVDNKKFGEVGLEVSVVEKLGPRITVQKVDTLVSPDEFMEELYSMNLGEIMSRESFRRSVRMVSPQWKEKEGVTNVLLECTERVAEHLRATGVYVKWFRFLVRVQDPVSACHRCYSFDHRVRDCKMRDDICRLCGQGGHLASRCSNPVHCRNCALRRVPADHPMLSMQCPVYAAMVARANARH